MALCHVNPADKKKLIDDVGRELVSRHGKQKYYKPPDVRSAVVQAAYSIDWACWAMCIFSDIDDFNLFHHAAGESCDYAEMRAEVLADLASGGSFLSLDLGLSWLEWPDIDLSSLFN